MFCQPKFFLRAIRKLKELYFLFLTYSSNNRNIKLPFLKNLLEEISAFPFFEVATGLPPPGPPGPAPDFSLKPGLEMTSMSDDVVVNVS